MSYYAKLLMALILVYTLLAPVNADHNITLYHPEDNEDCVLSSNVTFQYHTDEAINEVVEFFSNKTGEWSIDYYPTAPDASGYYSFTVSGFDPGTYSWTVCYLETTPLDDMCSSTNFTFTVTDAPYCAVLSETACSQEVNIGSEGHLKTRLGNTKGMWLENQDCNVWVEDASGNVVKTYDTMMNSQETDIQLDESGNWINVGSKKIPLTDSFGYYVYDFKVDNSWAWYGNEYTLKTTCNGELVSCNFNVTKRRLPDTEEMRALGKEGGGLVVGGLLVFGLIFVVWRYRYKVFSWI